MPVTAALLCCVGGWCSLAIDQSEEAKPHSYIKPVTVSAAAHSFTLSANDAGAEHVGAAAEQSVKDLIVSKETFSAYARL